MEWSVAWWAEREQCLRGRGGIGHEFLAARSVLIIKKNWCFLKWSLRGTVVGFYEWIVERSQHWRRLSHHPALSPSPYLAFKINWSSKIVLLPRVFHSTLITLELGAISSLLSVFPVCAFNASTSFSVDWERNLNTGLLCFILWSTLSCGSENGLVATMGSHLYQFQIHTNLQILACCTLLFCLTVSDPPLLVSL